MTRSAALLGLLAVAACAPAPPPRSPASAAVAQACRERADEVYARQNRADLSIRDTRDAPFSSSGLPGITSAGLGQRFGRDTAFADCLRSNAPGRGATTPAVDVGTGPTFRPQSQ